MSDNEAFKVGDVVETDFSGRMTQHIIAARFKVRNSQTGVVYEVVPRVPKSGSRIDHGWFNRIGYLEVKNGKILFQKA